MTDHPQTERLSFGLHCSICGADLHFLGAGAGTPGVMERARCWCAGCDRGFVLTVTMRAMNPSEEAVQRGDADPEDAPRLIPEVHEEDGRAPVPRELAPTNDARRAQRCAVPIDLPEGVEHGTRWAYEGHGCRCDPCTDRQAEAKAERRKAS